MLAAKDRPRRAGGGDDDVGLVCARVKVIKGDSPAPKALGQLFCAFVGAVGPQNGSGALVHQVASRLLANLARADDQDLLVLERAKYLSCQLHRNRGNRYR